MLFKISLFKFNLKCDHMTQIPGILGILLGKLSQVYVRGNFQ